MRVLMYHINQQFNQTFVCRDVEFMSGFVILLDVSYRTFHNDTMFPHMTAKDFPVGKLAIPTDSVVEVRCYAV